MLNLCANKITNIFVWKFGDADETQVQMAKHILRTVCTDVTNILFNFLAADMMMSVENPSTISSEVRQGDTNATTKSDSLWVFEIHWWTLWCVASGQSEDSGETTRWDQRTSHEAAHLPEQQSKAFSCWKHNQLFALKCKVKTSFHVFFTDNWRLPEQHRDLCRGVWLHAEEGRQEEGEVTLSLYVWCVHAFKCRAQSDFWF